MRALISDIHSNIEALRAVLADIERQGITEIFCLGDVVGYGPSPEDCIDETLRCQLRLMGNHDEAVVTAAYGFNPVAKQAIDWTRERLKPRWYSGSASVARWKFLCGLQLTHTIDTVMLVHGSPRNPTSEYILPSDTAAAFGEPSERLVQVFEMIQGPCFIGHSHIPGVIEGVNGNFLTPVDLDYRYEYAPDRKAVINIGSVGQPRDGDARACYVTMDDKVVTYHRVEYDWRKTAQKIRETPDLPAHAADRLEFGQ
jgi:predicted phosphodiesterase